MPWLMRLPFGEAPEGWTVGTQSVRLKKGVFVVILLKAFKAFKALQRGLGSRTISQEVQKTMDIV